MRHLFKAIYFGGMVVEAFARRPYVRHQRQMAKVERRVTLAERVLPAELSLAMGLLPLAYSLTPRLGFADYPLSPRARTALGIAGSLLTAAAVWLFWRAHRDLGANWSPTLEIAAQQTLTTDGVYGVIRHPMYASQLLWGLGQAMLLPNWLAGPGGLLMFLQMYLLRVPQEERMMLEHFGDAYRAYRDRTGAVLPRLGR